MTSPSVMAHKLGDGMQDPGGPCYKTGPLSPLHEGPLSSGAYALSPGAPEALSALVQQMDSPVTPLEMKWGRETKNREKSSAVLECCLPPHHGSAATIVSSNDIPSVTSCLNSLRGMALQKVIIT